MIRERGLTAPFFSAKPGVLSGVQLASPDLFHFATQESLPQYYLRTSAELPIETVGSFSRIPAVDSGILPSALRANAAHCPKSIPAILSQHKAIHGQKRAPDREWMIGFVQIPAIQTKKIASPV